MMLPFVSGTTDAWWLGLPLGLWDGLIGAGIGGLLAVVAGVVANVILSNLEEARDRRTRRRTRNAAVQSVRYELAINETAIDAFLLSAMSPKELTDSNYRRVQLTLLAELPEAINIVLLDAYEEMAFVETEMLQLRAKAQVTWSVAERVSLSQSQAKWATVRAQLENYLQQNPDPN